MKSFILLFFLSLVFNCSEPRHNKEEIKYVTQYGFNGKVKSVKSEVFDLVKDEDTFKIGQSVNYAGFDDNELAIFNKYGNLLSSRVFQSNGSLIKEKINIYDNNILVKIKENDYEGENTSIEYKFFKDSNDSVIKTIISFDNFKRIYKVERDNKNRAIKVNMIQNDTIYSTQILEYDNNNNITVENNYKYQNIPRKLIKRTFLQKNLKETENIIKYNSFDTLEYENQFFYNKNNKLILEKLNIDNYSNYSEIVNSYHQNGVIKESKRTPIGSRSYVITTNKYNKNGDLIEVSHIHSNEDPEDIWSYKYEYDLEKNWTKKLTFKNKKPLNIILRTFEYYNQ